MSKKYALVYAPRNGVSVTENFNDYSTALQRYYSVASSGVDFIRIEELHESTSQLLTE